MSDPLGISFRTIEAPPGARVSHVIHQHPLQRILAFTGRSIHDVIDSAIARREVAAYFKVHKLIARRAEILDLEQQWNSTPL